MKSILPCFTLVTFLALASTPLVAAPPANGPALTSTPSVFVNGIRREDEIAVVNTRMLIGACDPESIRSGMQFETYAICDEIGNRRWQSSDLAGFLAFDPSVRTIFFIHGNQITAGDAKCEGLETYRRLMHYGANDARIRFVIFSWPAAKVAGLLRDFEIKAARTGPAGIQLAWLVDQMPAETPVGLLGFSYGARIATAGLHVLAGGNLGSNGLPQRVHPSRPAVSTVLMADAEHAYWLGEGQHHGLALNQVDRMLSINSCQDPAMRFYAISVPGRGGPQALGLRGPTCLSAEQATKVMNRDISNYTGSRHDLYLYLSAPGVMGQIWDYVGSGH